MTAQPAQPAHPSQLSQPSSRNYGIALFVLLVILSGYALAATGNFDNPFRIFTQTTSEGGPRLAREAGAERPPEGGDFRGEGRGQDTISWSNIGGVLFNIWFLFAITVFIIIIQYPFRFVGRLMRARNRIRPVPIT